MFRKQFFIISNEQLSTFGWRRGVLTPGPVFGADRAGSAAFGAWLVAQSEMPAYAVADVIEEDFQRHLLPHVGGAGGRALRERRLGQLYRDTPFRHAAVQGRERDGRRDDRVLLSALTNPAPIAHWLGVIETQAVPLAALYSTSFLAALLVRQLGLAHPHLLLVTQQAGGLRESYFEGHEIKFSRLTALAEGAAAPSMLVAEVGKTRQFLTSTHQLEREQQIDVVIIATDAVIDALEPLCENGPEVRWRFIGLAAAAHSLGMAQTVPPLADHLLLAALARRTPASHYLLGPLRRFYRTWRARGALKLATGALLAVGTGWTGANLWAAGVASAQHATLREETLAIMARYRQASKALPPSVAEPAKMKAAVQLEQMLASQGPHPGALLAILSGALDQLPQLKLSLLEWQVARPAGAQENAPLASSMLGIGSRPRENLRVHAELALDQGNYRDAFDSMNRLVSLLSAQPGLRVRIVAAPFDISPGARLSGTAGAAVIEGKARFVLSLEWTR
ncbi:MAG: hypothetical protein V4857_06115 [Pseudomonadota bacterium]